MTTAARLSKTRAECRGTAHDIRLYITTTYIPFGRTAKQENGGFYELRTYYSLELHPSSEYATPFQLYMWHYKGGNGFLAFFHLHVLWSYACDVDKSALLKTIIKLVWIQTIAQYQNNVKFLTTVKIFIRSFRRCALTCTHVVVIEGAASTWQTVVTHHQTLTAVGTAS